MMLTATRRVVSLLVIALAAVPAISFPSIPGSSSSLIKGFSLNNQSLSTSPDDAPPMDRDPQHPKPDNPSLDLPSSPPSGHTLDSNATTPFRLLSDPDDDYDEYKLDCTGAQYFNPSIEVDCDYISHRSSIFSLNTHRDYTVTMPPAGLSYSKETSQRWANHFMHRLYKIRGPWTEGTPTETIPLDWWELEEQNNWGTGIAVLFRTYEGKGPADTPVTEQVVQVIREVMCGKSVDISWGDEKCRKIGEKGYSSPSPDFKSWDNGKEGR